MTPTQAARLRQKIADIRRVLAREKRTFGGYDDSRGLRYFPPQYFVHLGDFKGGYTYLRWFANCFPDDVGFSAFLFEWTLILFQNGKFPQAAQKALETYYSDTHLIDHFLGRPSRPSEPWEEACEDAAYTAYWEALGRPANWGEFTQWLATWTASEQFQANATRFIDLKRQLHGEKDVEKRGYLVSQLRPGLV